ncbi:UNVERIFIED_ORG: phage-related minor tail protein [Comamonas terrigena]
MVALQQGGQLKDMYGGITPALTAVSKATLALVNPTTVALGAVAALGVAWYQGTKEGEEFSKTLIMSGNAAGTSVGQLTYAAQMVGRTTGSYGLAIEATKQLAASGRVASSQMEVAAKATVGMAQVGAASVGDMVNHFDALGKAPVEASRKLNEQYRYLTASVYEQIRALDEQGRKEDAAALAQRTFATATADRVAEVKSQLNALGQTLNWVSKQASDMWNSVSKIGRMTPLEEQLELAQQQYETLRKGSARIGAFASLFGVDGIDTTKGSRQKLMDEMAVLEQRIAIEKQKSEAQRQSTLDNEVANAAIDKVTAANLQARNSQEKLTDALKEYRGQLEAIRKVNPDSKLLDAEQIKKTEAAIREQFKTKGTSRINPVDTAFQTQLQQLTQARATAEQTLANAQSNVAGTQEQATARLDAWLSVNQHAIKLDATRIAQLRNLAQQTDAAVEAIKALQDARARAERITSGMADVGSALAAAQGRTVEAEVARVTERFRKLRADLVAEGNSEGLLKLDKLIDIETAKAQLQDLQRQVDLIFGSQSRQEQTLQLSVTAGLTSELDAKRQILAMNTRTADQIAVLLPRMKELAAITGDPAMASGLADMEVRVQGLRTQANELKNAFNDAFGNSFANALESLADGTATLGESVRAFLGDLARGMAQWASQQLAMQAASSVMGLFNGGASAAAGSGQAAGAASVAGVAAGSAATAASAAADTAARTAHVAAITADTAATTASATAAMAFAPAITAATAAAGALTVAMQAAAAAAASSGAGSAVSGIAGVAATGFSDGGWTGPGGKYTPKGIVHAGEFVNRMEVVRQPGALAFLNEFNRVGMAALRGWQGYADGGMVVGGAHSGVPATANFQPATVNVGGSTVQNKQNFYLLDDPDRIAAAMGSSKGEQAITVMISRNPGKFRSLLGV